MWKNNIPVEISIRITKEDKKSTWLKLLKDYLAHRNKENDCNKSLDG